MQINSLRQATSLLRGTTEPVLTAILINDDGEQEIVSLPESHRQWNKVQDAIKSYQEGDTSSSELAWLIKDSVDIAQQVAEKFVKLNGVLDGRMAISGNKVTIDYEPIDGVLEAHIMRLIESDGTPKDVRNWRSFARFIENLYSNQSEYVREQFFGWLNYQNLNGHGFTITDDGCFIGYKGCKGTPELPKSINAGFGIVDGQPMNGYLPNKVGSVIEMPRKQVQDNPSVGCAAGLHVGTYNYASGWSRGVLLTVKVNPRDIVSVPTECDSQKIRCMRYEVLEVTKVEYTEPTYGDDEGDDDWDDWDSDEGCDDCGETYCRCDEDYCNYCDDYGHVDNESGYRCEDEDEDEDEGDRDEDDSDSGVYFAPNDVISFSYETSKHGPRNYMITVNSVGNGLVNGTSEKDGGYRSFREDKMSDIAVLNNWLAPTPADVTPEPVKVSRVLNSGDKAPEVGDNITISYTKLNGETKWYPNIVVRSVGTDFFNADTDHGIRKFTFDGVESVQNLGKVSREDVVRDEDDSFIRRFGFGTDPFA